MFEDISYRKLWQSLCSADRNHLCKVEGIMKINYVKLFFEFGPVVQEVLMFKRFLYLELLQPICSVEQNHLCNVERGHNGEHSCEVI